MKSLISSLIVLMLLVSSNIFAQEGSAGKKDLGNVYDVVDKKPVLDGFNRNYEKYFRKYRNYPNEAFKAEEEGIVYVSFVVTKEGDVADLFISQSSNSIFNNEALRLVKNTSGHWKPGKVKKNAVNTRMVVPVKFELSENDRETAELLRSFDKLGGKPLFVLDKKVIDSYVLLDDYNVQSVRVIKGQKAVELYGPQAKYGVVVITSKNGVPPIYHW